MDKKEAEQFWNYSKKIYEPLRATFLFLQDRFGLDVNLLLLCFWLGKYRWVLTDREFLVLIENVMPCRDHLIGPLRQARRFAKENDDIPNSENLTTKILLIELEAERLEQVTLIEALSKFCNKHKDDVCSEAELTLLNMRSYLKAASLPMNQEIESAFEILIDTTFVKE
jgi:uncharacterized protein (TIGR02444 family)